MTEEEARTKWCPFARQTHASETGIIGSGQPVFNRLEKPGGALAVGPASLCVASGCMAWRRQTVMIDRTTNEAAVLGVSKLESLEERWSAHGYCGLAGAPR